MSCPGVSGTMAVLYQAFKEKNSNNYPDAILMKAIAYNTADDLGNVGPDFKFGYGRINARKAYNVIADKSYFTGTITSGGADTHAINIPSNKKLAKIMLAWNDPAAEANSSAPLVNDLDLEVADPTGKSYLPYVLDISSTSTLNNPATMGIDNLNNMEQISLTNMPFGNYKLIVKGTSLGQGPQEYHVVYYTEDEGVELEYPTGGDAFVPSEEEVIRWSTPISASPFLLEYSVDSGLTWSTIAASVAPQDRFFEWTVPSAFTGKTMVRISSNGSVDTSDKFTISPLPTGINVTKICPDSMELTWTPVTGATEYNIYTLGSKYMEIIAKESSIKYVYKGAGYHPFKEKYFALDAINSDGTRSRIN